MAHCADFTANTYAEQLPEKNVICIVKQWYVLWLFVTCSSSLVRLGKPWPELLFTGLSYRKSISWIFNNLDITSLMIQELIEPFNDSFSTVFIFMCLKPKIIHTPGRFWLKVTLNQPASFYSWLEMTSVSQKILSRCTRGIIVDHIFSLYLHLNKKWMSTIIPFSIINRKAFIGYYSNKTLPIIADQLFPCLHWYFCLFVWSDELQLFGVGGSPCHHADL